MSTPDYSKYIHRSFELTKKNKWLWIFAALAGGGGGFPLGNHFSDLFDNLKTKERVLPDTKDLPSKTAAVLGDYTSALTNWIYSVPPYKWALLIILILLLITAGIAIAIVVSCWAKGSLIKGVEMAKKGTLVNLSSVSPQGFKYLEKLVRFSLILAGIMILLFVLLPLFWTTVFLVLLKISILKILWIIIGVLIFPVLILISLFTSTLVSVYGERFIVIKDMKPREAFIKAIDLGKKTLLVGIIMGIINKTIGFVVGIIGILTAGILLGIPVFVAVKTFSSNPAFAVLLGTITLISFIVFITAGMAISSALKTFNCSNWNQLFEEYCNKEDSK